MAFLDDYTNALEQYPDDHVTIEIVNLTVPGSALNVGETDSFDMRLRNSGPLQLADITVKIKGLNGTTVKDVGAIAPFVTEFVSGVEQIPRPPAHSAGRQRTSAISTSAPRTPWAI